MRWQGNRESDNVEDRRDEGGGDASGGGIGLPHIGVGGLVLVLLGSWFFHVNPLTVLGLLGQGAAPAAVAPSSAHAPPADDVTANFVRTILASTEDVWAEVFREHGRTYVDPKLVLYRGEIRTGCGLGQAAQGPFYCPADRKVYIDLGFYDVLRNQLGSPGDFAEAYVIAHEVGHHVQNLLGLSTKVEALRAREDEAQANATSVRVELQADCYAGVWAKRADAERHWLDQGDIASALNAASHIGDDALQRAAGRRVVPETFTHGSSAERVGWFERGLARGRPEDCNTFRDPDPLPREG
ncbi:MAG: neutral zinc metallopeptidase [Gammaproteobacteria bacterium]|nr:neutral zinc metallopeptidase [Gammaproteobacteria bacterium]